ncbi:hypothetical protein C9J01_22970 [Photobacterium rosenbergii]|uniref:Uncharacterized protein n=1 Tax=Photobacterium rosenbergii TaxID=294936 RepID=A0A2T3N745_9GAMM|nr:hypothetical protein [Photobacterium rosenbergii]PSW08723.1 hypothetical protein C9J01_22970 [Photobacterium rosenbergii]
MVKAVDLKVSPTPVEFWGMTGKYRCDVKNLRIIYGSNKLILTGTEKPAKSKGIIDKDANFCASVGAANDITKVVLIEDTACEKFVAYAQHHLGKNHSLEFSIVIDNQKYHSAVKAVRDDFGKIILIPQR